MSTTLPGGDVRGFYGALGIELPGWAQPEASVRCFAAPDAHARGDRDPSCSVNVATGAWRCWGCSAKGGAYDAALARGRTPRQAMDMLIAYGLAERRTSPRSHSTLATAGRVEQGNRRSAPPPRRERAVGEQELTEARARLGARFVGRRGCCGWRRPACGRARCC